MPYKDIEKRRAASRESMRKKRRREAQCLTSSNQPIEEDSWDREEARRFWEMVEDDRFWVEF